jgi:hypothetical protein
MAILIPLQPTLCQELPIVTGNVDYEIFRDTLLRIDELIECSGIDIKVMTYLIEEAEKEGLKNWKGLIEKYPGLSLKRQKKIQQKARLIQRCLLIKELTGLGFRTLSARLADSPLLQMFCKLTVINVVKVPSKSTLERYEKLFPENIIRECVMDLIQAASTPPGSEELKQKLRLEKEISMADYYLDTTCVKANIHYPVDWVLLRDGTRTLLKGIILIRRQGIKHRMDSPKQFITKMNKLCIKMSQARNTKDSKKKRKKIFREMKKLMKKIVKHGVRYRDLLAENWMNTDLTEKMTQQIIKRMDNVIKKMSEAIWQAHERIIGERQVKNNAKILSLYEEDIHVIIRKKADAMVEFGNILLLGEQSDGLIIDWKIYKDKVPNDTTLLPESLIRIKETYGCFPDNATSDKGFFSKKNKKFLKDNEIKDYTCPRAIHELKERQIENEFVDHQNRRAQTEARIGIFKNGFLGRPLRSKGFKNREISVAWAVLAHNLWVLARLPQQEELSEDQNKIA